MSNSSTPGRKLTCPRLGPRRHPPLGAPLPHPLPPRRKTVIASFARTCFTAGKTETDTNRHTYHISSTALFRIASGGGIAPTLSKRTGCKRITALTTSFTVVFPKGVK